MCLKYVVLTEGVKMNVKLQLELSLNLMKLKLALLAMKKISV